MLITKVNSQSPNMAGLCRSKSSSSTALHRQVKFVMEYDERKATWGGGWVQPMKAGLMFFVLTKKTGGSIHNSLFR